MWTLLLLLCIYAILDRGVEKVIERVSNILMPLLFIILIAFCINPLFMFFFLQAEDGIRDSP